MAYLRDIAAPWLYEGSEAAKNFIEGIGAANSKEFLSANSATMDFIQEG